MNFFAFLADEQPTNNWSSMIIIIVMIIVLLVMVVVSGRSQKKRQKQMQEMNLKLKAGDRIKSIGGIVGTIEKVTDQDTFLIRTGEHIMEIDRQAVYALDEITAPADVEQEPEQNEEAADENTAEIQPDPAADEEEAPEDEVKH